MNEIRCKKCNRLLFKILTTFLHGLVLEEEKENSELSHSITYNTKLYYEIKCPKCSFLNKIEK